MAIWHRDTWEDTGSAVSEPAMQQLLQRWNALKADAGPELPARDDLLPRNPAAILPRLLWLEHDGQGDFIYRHYGLDIQRHSQFDMTGRRVSEFGGQMGQFFLDRYRAVIEQRRPLYTVHYADRAASVFTWHRLALPVQDARGTLWVAVYLQPLETRYELLELVLNRSNDAIAALRPLPGEPEGSAHDWLILMANQTFRRLAGCDQDLVSGRRVSEVLLRWEDLNLNEHAVHVMQTGQSHEFEFELHDGTHWLLWSGWAGPLGDGVVLRLADVTEARRNSFRLYFDHSPDAVLHLAPGGTVLDANPAAEALLRIPARSLRSHTLASFDSPETAVLARFVASSENTLSRHETELQIPHSDGSSLDVEVRLTVYRDFLGNPTSSLTMRDISDRRRSEKAIHRLAFFDPLTGVPNRRLLRDRLEQDLRQARRHGQRTALLFVDLDHFKEVNDSLGHAVGDQLLIEATRRMARHLRESDTLGRMGGDEFTAILSGLESPDAALRVAEALIASLGEPFHLGEHTLVLGASVGITVFPDDGDDIDTLLRRADQALYLAKGSGRNRAAWFTPSLETHAQQRLKLVNELREAAARGQLSLHYQPIVTLSIGRVERLEALLRWQHPTLGAVPPVEFIPVAESSGQITDLGDWVVQQVTDQLGRWQSESWQPSINLNVSPLQFKPAAQGEDPAWMHRLLALDPTLASRITIEITEGLLLSADPGTLAQLQRLRDHGIGIALDDFGTGYSSLAYLHQVPVTNIKIDRSFVRDMLHSPRQAALCTGVISLARALGLSVTAEGVEQPEQLALLREAGCDMAQGFLLGRPVPVDQLPVSSA